ncbi:hypothetical protein H8959_000877 [Pygathrix nigripes]
MGKGSWGGLGRVEAPPAVAALNSDCVPRTGLAKPDDGGKNVSSLLDFSMLQDGLAALVNALARPLCPRSACLGWGTVSNLEIIKPLTLIPEPQELEMMRGEGLLSGLLPALHPISDSAVCPHGEEAIWAPEVENLRIWGTQSVVEKQGARAPCWTILEKLEERSQVQTEASVLQLQARELHSWFLPAATSVIQQLPGLQRDRTEPPQCSEKMKDHFNVEGRYGFPVAPAVSAPPSPQSETVKGDTPGNSCTAFALWMMGDHRLSGQPQPMEILNPYLGDSLEPHPGECPRETCTHEDLPEPCEEQTWATDPPESTRQDAPPWGSGVELTHLGSCSAQGEHRQSTASPGSPANSRLLGSPQQNQSTSTQVVFWAGILQAQMCVLDLEEELEKTEGLKAGLKCCLPTPPVDLPGVTDLHSSPPEDEDSGEDSSEPEGEGQACLREGTPDSSLQWVAEEDSMFFSNPLFLGSPFSENSASGERFSWGASDSHASVRTGPESPATLETHLPEGTVLWELESEPDLGDSAATSGHRTPPFPVPVYKPHSICWASVAAIEGGSCSTSWSGGE